VSSSAPSSVVVRTHLSKKRKKYKNIYIITLYLSFYMRHGAVSNCMCKVSPEPRARELPKKPLPSLPTASAPTSVRPSPDSFSSPPPQPQPQPTERAIQHDPLLNPRQSESPSTVPFCDSTTFIIFVYPTKHIE
jgi:hypothetical protein